MTERDDPSMSTPPGGPTGRNQEVGEWHSPEG